MTNALQTYTPPQLTRRMVDSQLSNLGFNPAMIQTIKSTVALGATDSELLMFLSLAKKYGLDPFAKQIWCLKYAKKDGQGNFDYANTRATIFSGRDGFKAYAQSHGDEYKGLQSNYVCENDVFELHQSFDVEKGEVVIKAFNHNHGHKERGKPVGAWAVSLRVGKSPVIVYIEAVEFKQESPIWRKFEQSMLVKCAESVALRKQWVITGLVSADEVDPESFVKAKEKYPESKIDHDEKALLLAENVADLNVIAGELAKYEMDETCRNRLKKAYKTRSSQLAPVDAESEPTTTQKEKKSDPVPDKPRKEEKPTETKEADPVPDNGFNRDNSLKTLESYILKTSEPGADVAVELLEYYKVSSFDKLSDSQILEAIDNLKKIATAAGDTPAKELF